MVTRVHMWLCTYACMPVFTRLNSISEVAKLAMLALLHVCVFMVEKLKLPNHNTQARFTPPLHHQSADTPVQMLLLSVLKRRWHKLSL